MSRIALIGSNGQLGSDIARLWPSSALGARGDELVGLTHADIDVTDADLVRSVLSGIQPSLVINTAAFHRVDDCEKEALQAFQVNGIAVKNVAEVCRDIGAALAHFSTDYVFDGEATAPYDEDDIARPISAYGVSKLAGENFLRYVLPNDHILVRTAGLYGIAGASGKGGNFVETMLRYQREGRPIRVVQDQISTPTYTVDLADAFLQVIARHGRGTFHITNAGECSWYEVAKALFGLLELNADLKPTTALEFGARALRPAYSVLANRRLQELVIAQPRFWREALEDYLRLKGRLAA